MNKKVFILSAIFVLVFLSICAWRYARTSLATATEPVKSLPVVSVTAVSSGTISRTIELDGTVEAEKLARISSPAEGPIGDCRVREGDHVTKGQQILCIGRDKTISALLSAAQADLTKEKDELERVTKLVENGAIPGDQLEIARSKYENAKAQLAKAEESRGDYWILAPFSGIVSKVMVVQGNYVAPRTPLIEIFDPASLVVRFSVPEADSQSVRIGQTLSVRLDAYPGKIFPARICHVYPTLDASTRTRLVEVTLLENISMIPGLFARIRMDVQTHENAVLVPAEAVMVNAKGDHVAYVIEEGKAVARKVSTGIEAGSTIEILSGVKPGEQIVVAGNEKLKDGMAVKLMEKQGESGTKKDAAKSATLSGEGTPQ